MSLDTLYSERLERYCTAMRNGTPDRVPIRPFAAEFCATHAGFTCQEVTHDVGKALEAVRICCRDYDWDAAVPNMVYVWTGLTEAIGLNYFGVPGLNLDPQVGFQYREPPETRSFMRADEYDQLIENPTGFLFEKWLPRVSSEVREMGDRVDVRNNLSFLKGGMAMLSYFYALGDQVARMKTECGTVSAISGILKAPLDILGDKFRGYLGLVEDLHEQPEKVLEACRALMPHLLHVALSGADPAENVPVGIWMHRGCVPFVSFKHFEEVYWSTLRPIIEEIWRQGHQTLFYAEGNWDKHLSAFSELPAKSIVYHVDRGDIFAVHKQIGKQFCLSGGVPNTLLSYGTQQEVKDCCKAIIDEVAPEGGYILDASAIIQNDAKVENIRAMTDFVRDYGVYPSPAPTNGASSEKEDALEKLPIPEGKVKPGVCFPWEAKREEIPEILGDESLIRRVWEENEELAYQYIWHCVLSF